MKSNKRSSGRKTDAAQGAAAAVVPAKSGPAVWYYIAGLAAAVFVAFEVYGPALHGPFLFDDRYLPFFAPGWASAPFGVWIHGMRPLLMTTFWLNFQISQTDAFWYHVFNVAFHVGNAVLIWLIVARVLEWAGVDAGPRRILSLFSGVLFLVHPVQTEAVAYVASRSENLSVLLFNAALALFVYRRPVAIGWRTAAAILVLFVAACLTKEHAAVLPALLLLTDYYWNPGFTLEGMRRNWRLYAPIVAGVGVAAFSISRVLRTASTAGFAIKDLSWYEYFFTQCRAIWIYLRMFVLPYGLNVDHEFAVSRSVVDHGAITGMLALAGVSVAAWIYRRRLPLASYGWFAFLILLAPTSSFVPIRDLLAERRLYLPFIGLLLITCEFLRRVRASRPVLAGALACVSAVFAFAAYQRNNVWSDPVELWKDAAGKSPQKSRPAFQLAYAYYAEGRCAEAAGEYEKASRLEKPDYALYVDWALACDCAQKPDAALDKLRQALALEKTAHAYATMAKVYAEQNRRDEALAALAEAEKVDPKFETTYVYRGNVYLMANEYARAAAEFRRALALNPADINARNGLDMAERQQPRM
jgi:Flp pilus assembly protein TadD